MDHNDVLIAFLQAWRNEDYEQMFQFSQKTWKASHTVEQMKIMYQDAKMKEFNIFSNTYVSPSAHKFNVDFTLVGVGRIMSVVNVICEAAPEQPRPYGEWGVNPVSVQNVVSKIPEPKAEKKPVMKKSAKAPVRKPKANAKQ